MVPDLFLVILVLEDLEKIVHSVLAHGTVVSLNLGLHQVVGALQVLLQIVLKIFESIMIVSIFIHIGKAVSVV
jgi:hypothetical protein